MAQDRNKVEILGRIGNDIELRFTSGGVAVCNLSVATNKFYKSASGESQKTTTWHKVVVWGKRAESCHEYLSKGARVLIEGELENKIWEDKNGVKHYTDQIHATNVNFLDYKTPAAQTELPAEAPVSAAEAM